jgi:hypothetical protein
VNVFFVNKKWNVTYAQNKEVFIAYPVTLLQLGSLHKYLFELLTDRVFPFHMV